MADIGKVLGQAKPASATWVDLYTVPERTQTIISSLLACDQSASNDSIRVAIRPRGAVLQDKHYIYYNKAVSGNDTLFAIFGMTLGPGDIVAVYDANGDTSFSLFGVETTL